MSCTSRRLAVGNRMADGRINSRPSAIGLEEIHHDLLSGCKLGVGVGGKRDAVVVQDLEFDPGYSSAQHADLSGGAF